LPLEAPLKAPLEAALVLNISCQASRSPVFSSTQGEWAVAAAAPGPGGDRAASARTRVLNIQLRVLSKT
jgi:hypothetical protein